MRLQHTLLLMICVSALNADTLIYRQITGNRESRHIYTICRTDAGYVVRRVHQSNEIDLGIEEITTDSAFSTLAWHYLEPTQGTDFRAHRAGNKIYLAGVNRAVPVNRVFTIDGRPWMQTFALNMKSLINAPCERSEFWALGAVGNSEIKAADFTARKGERTTISVSGRPITAQRIRITLAGARAPLWHGNYFHNVDTGAYVGYEGINGPPGTPPTRIDLVATR